jgi:hypothetical protein
MNHLLCFEKLMRSIQTLIVVYKSSFRQSHQLFKSILKSFHQIISCFGDTINFLSF